MSHHPGHRRAAAGFTLVELLIGVGLALLIGVAIGSVYLGTVQSYRTGTGLTQVQEQSRFASLLVTPVVRQAGYVADPVLVQADPTTVFVSGNNLNAIRGYASSAPTVYPSLSSSAISAGTDVLAVAFVGQGTVTTTDPSGTTYYDTPIRTCLGEPVYDTSIAVNVYYVSRSDASGVSSLYCYTNRTAIGGTLAAGTATTGQPLIAGVSAFQVRYGIDALNNGSQISYYTADQVAALSTPPAGFSNPWLSQNPWLAVSQVQITYTIDSSDVVERARGGRTASIAANGRLRTVFTTTVDLRNRLHN